MRAFIAIGLPEEIRKIIFEEGGRIPGRMTGVLEQNMHITLQFLGELSNADIEATKKILSSIKRRPFEVEIAGLLHFGGKEIRTVYAGVQDNGQIKAIYDEISSKLPEADIKIKTDRKYVPHVTIGRVKGGQDNNILAYLDEHADRYFGKVEVRSISLKKSVLAPEGPVYSTLYESHFG